MIAKLNRIEIAKAAKILHHESTKHFGRRARVAAGRDDLNEKDYVALREEIGRQGRIRLARQGARELPPRESARDKLRRLSMYAEGDVKREAREAKTRRMAAFRRAAQVALRRAGGRRELTSDFGSNYYQIWRGEAYIRVRISDHAIPQTVERAYNKTVGRTCCDREIILSAEMSDGDLREQIAAALDLEIEEAVQA
ncbi:MAG TPA: hypothetical protein VNA25_13500 [Phycisphaerae bacterium]|nr:hypothetical protein [Phycisphaerae bacterium]